MIVGFHAEIMQRQANNDLDHKLSLLPSALREKITTKRQHLDVQLSVTGHLLLLKLIDHFGISLTLDDLQYSKYHRPYFSGDFDFSISHSGNRVICCGTSSGKVGVDIELIKPVDLNQEDYFTTAEQQKIRAAQNPDTEFFNYWVRKEAVLKALGTGVYTPLLEIDVSADEVVYRNETFYLLPLNIDSAYAGCIACDIKQDISISKVEI